MPKGPVFYTPIKRNHMIAPFGVGSLLLARNGVGVVVCGLDEWMRERPNDGRNGATWLERNQLSDPHLQRRLGVNRLLQPPAVADQPDDRNTWFARVARFPRTEYCINPTCRRVVERDARSVSQGRCEDCDTPAGGRRSGWPTQQTPLVLACEGGHLSEIPWAEWVHDTDLQAKDDEGNRREISGMCGNPALTYKVATDVTAPVVACDNCPASISLATLRNQNFPCPGERAWLPGSQPEACDAPGRVLERTSTSLYYPEIRSALYLPHGPELDHRLMALLAEPVGQVLLKGYRPGEAPDQRDLERLVDVADARGITTTSHDVARHVIVAAASADDVEDHVVRSKELEALLDGTDKTSSTIGLPSLVVEPREVRSYDPAFGSRVAAVSSVPRLAETRALIGFSRIEPSRVSPPAGFKQLWGAELDAAEGRDWVLAHRVYGEGILILLNPDAVRAWEADVQGSGAWFTDGRITPAGSLEPRYVLAHTLSHVLLREAAAVCGYALPSLRERLYVTADSRGEDQTGVLIFTAEGDAYGTLGGLVELSEPGNLEALFNAAVDNARWCGADPVCMHPPEGAGLQTTPGCCHHCLLLPETSCENFNLALDRAALIGGRSITGFAAAPVDA